MPDDLGDVEDGVLHKHGLMPGIGPRNPLGDLPRVFDHRRPVEEPAQEPPPPKPEKPFNRLLVDELMLLWDSVFSQQRWLSKLTFVSLLVAAGVVSSEIYWARQLRQDLREQREVIDALQQTVGRHQHALDAAAGPQALPEQAPEGPPVPDSSFGPALPLSRPSSKPVRIQRVVVRPSQVTLQHGRGVQRINVTR